MREKLRLKLKALSGVQPPNSDTYTRGATQST